MSTQANIIRHLDGDFSIALGYTVLNESGEHTNVYTTAEECRDENDGMTPATGFVIIRRESGIKRTDPWFPTYDEAESFFEEHKAELTNSHPQQTHKDGVEVATEVELGKYTLRVLKSTHADGNMAEINIELRDPAGDDQALVTVCANGTSQTAMVMLWEDETDDDYTDSLEIHFRKIDDDDEEEIITDFSGEYDFLNNAYDTPIIFRGHCFHNAEAAFQSMKCETNEERAQFTGLSARQAKVLGRSIALSPNWNQTRDFAMHEVVMTKFSQAPVLASRLLKTGDAEIRPQNVNHDNYWGSCQCAACVDKEKKNKLGIILMQVRSKLKDNQKS